MYSTDTVIFVSLLVSFAIVVLIFSFVEIRRLASRYQADMAAVDSSKRVLNLFLHKLATENNISEAMSIIASQMREDLSAESVGIYMPDVDPVTHESILRGMSCTTKFLQFTGPDGEYSPIVDRSIFADSHTRNLSFRQEIIRPGVGLMGKIMENRKAILVKSLADDLPDTNSIPDGFFTMMVIPLIREDRWGGLVCAINRTDSGESFTPADMEKFKELSDSTVALASTLVLIYAERANQDRIRRELAFSAELQMSLLPAIPPMYGSIHIAPFIKPCHEVSGDFYDFVAIDENRSLLMIADATGKGIPACMLTSMCRSFVRSLVEHCECLEKMLMNLNRLVAENSESNFFVTAAFIVLNKKDNTCRIARAGHPPFLIARPNMPIEELKPEGDALGAWDNDTAYFETISIPFEEGMRICIYTDGITEAYNTASPPEQYQTKRLKQALQAQTDKNASAEETIQEILADISHFAGDAPQADDQTIIVITR